jgi:hypothetical protein
MKQRQHSQQPILPGQLSPGEDLVRIGDTSEM